MIQFTQRDVVHNDCLVPLPGDQTMHKILLSRQPKKELQTERVAQKDVGRLLQSFKIATTEKLKRNEH